MKTKDTISDDHAAKDHASEEDASFGRVNCFTDLLDNLHFIKAMMAGGETSHKECLALIDKSTILAEGIAKVIESVPSSVQLFTIAMTLEAALLLAQLRVKRTGSSDCLWGIPGE